MPDRDPSETPVPQTPVEVYLSELPESNRPRAIAVIQVVANHQGFTDWRLAQWQHITADSLPALFERLRAEFPDPGRIQLAFAVIKGVARCAWRQNLISGHQLAGISTWRGAVKG